MKAALLLFCFWYPGEAGTSAQAQPLLDQFAALLSTHTPGISWRTTYLPTESEGLAFIRAKSPSFGIVSYPVYYKYRASLSMTRLASTRLLPDGRAEERLTLMAGRCPAPHAARTVHASQPFTGAMLMELFGSATDGIAWSKVSLRQTPDMLDTLKKLATTQSCDLAILSETERRSLAAMKAPWATQLTTVIRSALFPTPQVVRFGDQPNATAVQEALRRLTADPLAKPLLAEMRLAGFVVP